MGRKQTFELGYIRVAAQIPNTVHQHCCMPNAGTHCPPQWSGDSGDGLDFCAKGGNIILPSSGLYVHFANGAHSLSPRPCPTKDYCDNLSV